jgi:hypothetical protein
MSRTIHAHISYVYTRLALGQLRHLYTPTSFCFRNFCATGSPLAPEPLPSEAGCTAASLLQMAAVDVCRQPFRSGSLAFTRVYDDALHAVLALVESHSGLLTAVPTSFSATGSPHAHGVGAGSRLQQQHQAGLKRSQCCR